MEKYIAIYTSVWNDKKIKKFLNQRQYEEIILFNYLLVNPNINFTGIYEPDMDICRLKMSFADFDKTFNNLITEEMIKWDANKEMIFVINRFKYIPNNESPKIKEATVKELKKITHPFKDDFLEKYKDIFSKPAFNALIDNNDILLNAEQVKSFVYDVKWDKQRIKKFYMDKFYSEQKIDEIINKIFPNLK